MLIDQKWFRVVLLCILFFFSFPSFAADKKLVSLPLTFEPNYGQADAQAMFLARTPGGVILLTPDGAIITASTKKSTQPVRIHLNGAVQTSPKGEWETGGFANYYRSQDRSRWLTHIPMYARVRYPSVAKGIDILFHGREGQLEYDFEVAPGASVRDINFTIQGADRLSISPDGSLHLGSNNAGVRLLPPVGYQLCNGRAQPVQTAYHILRDGSVGFSVGAYDHSIPLTIDPVVQYSSIIGVNNNISVQGIQVDASGNLVIAGDTFASNYPVVNGKPGALNGTEQIYITKLDPTGHTILYSTYIPASSFSTANALVLDANGNAYVSGVTSASDFPLTSANLGSCGQFCNAGFVTKFAPDGTLVYATLLSSGQALPKGLVVDGAGSAYVAGLAADNTLKTVNAFQPSFVGQICTNCTNGFFAKLNATGDAYEFASYFVDPKQTSGETFAQGIGIDGAGNVYLAGQGAPPIFNPWQIGGGLFIAKFASDGKTLLFSSGFGGGNGSLRGIAVGADGTLYLAGRAFGDFPFTLNASTHMVKDNGNGMFAAAVDPALTGLKYSVYLGDGNVESMFLNSAGHLFVGGSSVQNLPPLANAVVSDASSPGFALELDAAGNPVTVTEFGGHLTQEIPTAITSDGSGNLYVAGTISPGNEVPQPDPVVVGPTLGQVTGASFGSFFAKIIPANAPQISLNTVPPFLVLRNAGSADLHISNIALGGSLSKLWGNCGSTVPAGTSCVLTVSDNLNQVAGGTVTITSDAQPSVQAFTIPPPNSPPVSAIGDFVLFSNTPTLLPPQLSGSITDQRVFTISNVGTADAAINAFFANGGVSQTNNCPATLVPGVMCTIQATILAGAGQPSLRISYDNGLLKDYELFVPVSTAQFLLSAPGISFGIQQIQGVAIPRVVTVTNTGQNTASSPQPSLTGDAEFSLVGNTCTAPLAPHASCALAVQFNPVIAGSRNANLFVGSQEVQFFGQGEFHSVIQVSPLQLNFFPVIVHRPPFTVPLTLTNTSANAVGLAGFVFSLPDYSETDNCQGQVPANGSCTVQVGFSAQAVGPRDATMTINFLGGEGSQTLTLSGGEGVTPLDVTPASLNFGSALTGTTSSGQGVVLANGRQGTAQAYTLNISGDFVISQNVCPSPMPGFFGCTLQVAFAPATPGPQQGTLTVSYPTISETSVVVLNGTGVTTAPVVSMPATFALGSTPVGTPIQQPVTISNTGNAALTISGFSLSGQNAADFSVAAGQCSTIAAGNSCALQIGFNPAAPLQKQATLTIADNGLNNPHSLALSGTGVGPFITLPPPTFVGQAFPGSSTGNQILIGNSGNASLVISSLSVTGTNAAEFRPSIAQCGSIPGPGTCLILVTFTPGAVGTRTANIVINDNQVGSPQSFQVSGTGLGPAYSVPSSLDLGNQLRGTTGLQTVTVTNTGNMSLDIHSTSGSGDFSASHNCFSIAPSASCKITVSFLPTAVGPRTGTLTITDNTFSGSRQITLTGNGTDFQPSPGSGPASVTVASGQTATYNLNMTSTGGFSGSVSLDCTGAPQAATCTVNPSTIQLTGSGSVPFTVTVTTQKTVSSLGGVQITVAGFGLVSFLSLAPLLLSRRLRNGLRARGVAAIGLVLLATCLAVSGCGGGGAGGGNKNVQTTPPGTYTLALTATSSGVSRQLNLTLVVQ